MIFQRLKTGIKVSDRDFDAIYTRRIRAISKFHFTPVEVAKAAAGFLVGKTGDRVLDVGSGAGKFCMVGAACTEGVFTGVEQRAYLYEIADLLSRHYKFTNTNFIHCNITEIDFRKFDSVYFYNAFYENIFSTNPIDSSVDLNKAQYILYAEYMKAQLTRMPAGTRLATYFSFKDEIPDCYKVVSTSFDMKLKFWEKVV